MLNVTTRRGRSAAASSPAAGGPLRGRGVPRLVERAGDVEIVERRPAGAAEDGDGGRAQRAAARATTRRRRGSTRGDSPTGREPGAPPRGWSDACPFPGSAPG